MEIINYILTNSWAFVVSAASAIGILWGIAKAVGALLRWIRARVEEYRKRKAIPKQTLEELLALKKETMEDMRKLNQRFDSIERDVIQLKSDLRVNNDQTATVMLAEMMKSYHTYVLNNEPIPLDVQTAMVEMAKQYRASGWHNHIPADFEQKIQSCRIK